MCKNKQEITTEKETPAQIQQSANLPITQTLGSESKQTDIDTTIKEAENFMDSVELGLKRYSVGENHFIYKPIHNTPEILERVFPNVYFYNASNLFTNFTLLGANFNNKTFTVKHDFNILYSMINKKSSFNDQVTALIQTVVGTACKIEVVFIEEMLQRIEPMPYEFNYKVSGLNNKEKITFLLAYEEDKFLCITQLLGIKAVNTVILR